MDNYFEEWKNRAVKRANKRNSESIARAFLKMGKLTLEEIAEATGLTLKRIQKLAENVTL